MTGCFSLLRKKSMECFFNTKRNSNQQALIIKKLNKLYLNQFRDNYSSSYICLVDKNNRKHVRAPTFHYSMQSQSKPPDSSSFLLSSSGPNETTVDNPAQSHLASPHIKLDPRAIFPWRHSPSPLPRLVPDNIEFKTEGGYVGPQLPTFNKFMRSLSWGTATGFLDGKVYNYFQWKRDLEEGFMMAFAVAVQGVLMDVYDVSKKQDSKESESNQNENEIQITKSPIDFNHSVNPVPKGEIPPDIHHDEKINSNTRSMLETNLISLYKSAHEHNKHQLQITLFSEPKSAQIMSLLSIPFLTRQEVIEKPALKHSFRNIAKSLHQLELKKGSQLNFFEIGDHTAQALDEMANKQIQRNDDNMAQISIVAQVAIQCDEIFKVVDLETGETVQGDPEARKNDVTHLVRFEVVVDLDPETGMSEVGRWQITDLDDLLDGNIWFL